MSRPDWLTVPNGLTLLRIALTPFFGYFWWKQWFVLAIATFVVASASDFLDGLFARLLDQRSKLGQVLDPAADKFMVLVTFLTAAVTGAVPWWLAALVITRDMLLATGSALFHFVLRDRALAEPTRWRPTRIGKYATFFTVLTIGFALLQRITESERLRPFVGALGVMCAATIVVSGIQYTARAFIEGGKLLAGGEK
jgi:cardiolipin synthase